SRRIPTSAPRSKQRSAGLSAWAAPSSPSSRAARPAHRRPTAPQFANSGAAMRLDQAIAARFPDISRRKARELIAAGRVLVNEHPVRIASREIADDAQITVAADVPAL